MTAHAGGVSLHLDDLSVGDTFESGTHPVDAQQIVEFARRFDPQPFHVDGADAQDSFFGGLVASGWHTAAMTMRLLVDSVPLANGIIGAGCEIAWPSATRAGDVLQVRSEILDITPSRSRPNRATVLLWSRTFNQSGEVRQELKSRLIAFRES